MLRDGQFLAEPPIKIGAHYCPKFQYEMNETELVTQSMLLGDPSLKRRRIHWPVVIVVGYIVVSITLGIARAWQ